MSQNLETIVFGGGCFWCTEALFTRIKGVVSALPGYAGGTLENPTYEQVCTGTTGYAEVAEIQYDPSVTSLNDLLDVFWKTHDPTTLNRQGNDTGPQYRSVIFYTTEDQKAKAEESKKALEKAKIYRDPIVTEIKPLDKFYKAEDYHMRYFENNSSKPYCQFVIAPKIDKLEMMFKDKLKD